MIEADVVWTGATLGYVAEWSHTRGELLAPRRQRLRPFGDEVQDEDTVDAFGLPKSPTAPASSLTVPPAFAAGV